MRGIVRVSPPVTDPLRPGPLLSMLLVAMLGASLSGVGGWAKDRLSQETREAANAVRIEKLEEWRTRHEPNSVSRDEFIRLLQRVEDTGKDYVTRAEFNRAVEVLQRSQDQMRAEILTALRERRSH